MIKKIVLGLLLITAVYPLNKSPEKISGKSFRIILEKIENAEQEERQALADKLINEIKESAYPIFDDDTTAFLLYQGDADSVYLIGDMTDWTEFVPLIKINGTNLFYYTDVFPSTARLEYWFTFEVNGIPIVDPLNKYKSHNGFGELSVLAMPEYSRHEIFKDYEEGRKGNYFGLKEYEILSKFLGYNHTVHVYLPPNYQEKDGNYPVIYFQDGREYIEYAIVPHVLNKLIDENKIEPVIAVFVTPPNLHEPKLPNRMTEYDMNDKYVNFFADELVPYIDSIYSTSKDPHDRLVIGDSYGGLISTYIAFMRPEVFYNAYSQSGYHSFFNDKMIELFKSSAKMRIKLYVDIGTYETKVGASFLPLNETDFLAGNRRLKKVLQEKEYDFIYKEYHEGHTWGNWRRHLIDALEYFFRKAD